MITRCTKSVLWVPSVSAICALCFEPKLNIATGIACKILHRLKYTLAEDGFIQKRLSVLEVFKLQIN